MQQSSTFAGDWTELTVLSRDIASSVALGCHSWLHYTSFLGDVQASLMDMPFDGSRLFGEKADSRLERFTEIRVPALSLGLSTAPLTPLLLLPLLWQWMGVQTCPQYSPYPQGQQAIQSFCGLGSHKGHGTQSQRGVQSPL